MIEKSNNPSSVYKSDEMIVLTQVFPLLGYDATRIIIKVYNYIK